MAEKIYKCLNPVGIQEPIDLYPLAPRLDKLDGKTIFMRFLDVIDGEVLIPLRERLLAEYPDVNWKIERPFSAGGGMSEEGMKDADAVVQGVLF